MTTEDLKLIRLANQHLLAPADVHTVVRDLCGVQAQFLSNAFHALRTRSNGFNEENLSGFVKSWTLRGTMHLFDEKDLPLMLHQNRTRFLRPCDTFAEDEYIKAERKRLFADLIKKSVTEGIGEREALKQLCFDAGMTETEAQSVFNPWGGLIRALCETGMITHTVSEKKAFAPCPAFVPMDKNAAELELALRYFTHYGPATVRDAAYFFGCTQAEVKRWIDYLPVKTAMCEGKTHYYIEETAQINAEMPQCVFLAGFDPLMLGYEKRENPFLPQENLRGIFIMSGIVMPALLVHGRVVGKWKKTGKKLTITPFEMIELKDKTAVHSEAERVFGSLKTIAGI